MVTNQEPISIINKINHHLDFFKNILEQFNSINAGELYKVIFQNCNNIESTNIDDSQLFNLIKTKLEANSPYFLSPKSSLELPTDTTYIDNVNINTPFFSNINSRRCPYIFLPNQPTLQNLQTLFLEILDFKYIYIDTETTSLNNPLPVQISVVITDCYHRIIETKNFYIKRSNISEQSISVHNITPDFLDKFASPINEVFDYLDNLLPYNSTLNSYQGMLIGYNVNFDITTLKNFYHQYSREMPDYLEDNLSYCCFKNPAFKSVYKNLNPPNLKLTTLVDILQLDPTIQDIIRGLKHNNINMTSHNSLYDTIALYLIASQIFQTNSLSIPHNSETLAHNQTPQHNPHNTTQPSSTQPHSTTNNFNSINFL